MSDNVNKPDHYQSNGMKYIQPECIHITRHLSFNLGNAFKYIWRAGMKGDKCKEIEDLFKALWYVNDFVKSFGETANDNIIASQIFSMIQFENNSTEKIRYEALNNIIHFNPKKARAEIKSLISNLLWRDFQNATNEEIDKIKKLTKDEELPEFVKNFGRI